MVKIVTSQGVSFFISPEDEERVRKHTWCVKQVNSSMFYVMRTVRDGDIFKTVYLHRYISDCPSELVVHHINSDTLDNRRENLEVVTQKENLKYRYSGEVDRLNGLLDGCVCGAGEQEER